jgi:hypothetical protein
LPKLEKAMLPQPPTRPRCSSCEAAIEKDRIQQWLAHNKTCDICFQAAFVTIFGVSED